MTGTPAIRPFLEIVFNCKMQNKDKYFLSLQSSEKLSDGELSRLASRITQNNLKTIAINYLVLTQDTVDNIMSASGSDVEEFKRRVLFHWRNCAAPKGRKVRHFF